MKGIRWESGEARLREGWRRWEGNTLLLLSPVILLLAIFFVWPLVQVLEASFGGRGPFTLQLYDKAIFGQIAQNWWEVTIEQTIVTTGLCLVLGYPVAYYLASSTGWRRTLVLMAVVIPFLTHFVAQTSVWRVILGRRGWINESLTGLGIIDEPLEILFTSISGRNQHGPDPAPVHGAMHLCRYAGNPKGVHDGGPNPWRRAPTSLLESVPTAKHAGGLGGDFTRRSPDHRVLCGPRHLGEYPAARDRVISTGRGAVQFSAGDGHPGRGLDTLSGVCAMGRLQASVPSRGGIDGPKGRRAGAALGATVSARGWGGVDLRLPTSASPGGGGPVLQPVVLRQIPASGVFL